MYMPGRSRTGWRPLRIEMSLAAYATRGSLRESAGPCQRAAHTPIPARKSPGQRAVSGLLILPEPGGLEPVGFRRAGLLTTTRNGEHDAGPAARVSARSTRPCSRYRNCVAQTGSVDRRSCTRRRGPRRTRAWAATAAPTISGQTPDDASRRRPVRERRDRDRPPRARRRAAPVRAARGRRVTRRSPR